MTAPRPPLRAPRRIVLIAGPSGSGKGLMTRRGGLPLVPLDEFYRDGEDPDLPRRFGIVDWDDPQSWDRDSALAALSALAHNGEAEIPTYSISSSRRTGSHVLSAQGADLLVAEGIFAAELIEPLSRTGLLADAMVLDRPVPLVFAMRLLRDLREARKPPLTLLRRGIALAREQPSDLLGWTRAGMRPVGLRRGVRELRDAQSVAEAARHHRDVRRAEGSPASPPESTLRIAAVCFLRETSTRTELLAVRKRDTEMFMQVGGKIDEGESPVQAALREVSEEIGVDLRPGDLLEVGSFRAPAANEAATTLDARVYISLAPLPEPLVVRAELAEHCWLPVEGAEEQAAAEGMRLAPLMVQDILPALRRL